VTLGNCISRLIEAGISPEEAGAIAAEIYALGVSSVSDRNSNAARQQRYRERKRNERNESVTNRNADGVTTTVTNRNESVTNNASTVLPIDTKIKNSKKQNSDRPSRGTRISSDWAPSDADRLIAKQEGLSDSEINREALRFRDFWTGKAGAGGVKLDWAATWRNWVRTTAERLGRTPSGTSAQATTTGFYAKFGSEEQDAWDRYGRETRNKAFPRDKSGGWNFPTRWPPGYKPQASLETAPAPALRTMQ
jgi:hypothetical protein